MARLLRLSLVVLGSLSTAIAAAEDRPDATSFEFFEKNVRPVLVAKCQSCHGPEKQKAGLRLDTRDSMMRGGESGPAIAPGDAGGSLLIEAIGYQGDTQMPPKGKLDDKAIRALTEWVKSGAHWPEVSERVPVSTAKISNDAARSHWSFQQVKDVPPPAVNDLDWAKGPIDRFVLAKLEQRGLRPVQSSDKRTLIRRATFDLTGLPPAPEEVDAFLADSSPEAFSGVVDRLLAAPQFGERWGRHWLDVARYGEDQAHTFESRKFPFGFRYRDWVVRSLNDDMPYDRFVIEQIAGDLLEGPGREERLAAVGFFALGPHYYGNAIADELDDRVDTLSRGFLGLTVSCARCHDHKFDPIPTQDYYSLAGVFASTQYKEFPAAPKEQIEAFDQAQATIKRNKAGIDAFVSIAATGGLFVLPKGMAEKSLTGEARKLLQALRKDLAALEARAPAPYPVVHSLADATNIANLKVHIRGNPKNLGEDAPRRFLSVLSHGEPSPFAEGSGRLELARAIASPDNPLTARVMVNRIWEHHFGRGLVATPSNFGALGEPPTHPELLDYLARRFVALGWSTKAIHREIMLSATYQLSSRIDPRCQEIDPDNALLWRMNRRRLEVEAWRDAMLAVSGNLDPTLGGPSQDLVSPENRRRTLYASISRHSLDGLLRLFDFPDPNITSDKRTVTAVPLQQLFVLNSEFMALQAQALSRRLAAGEATDSERIRHAYPLLYGRPADDDEVSWGVEFLGRAGSKKSGSDAVGPNKPLSAWEQYAQVLLGSNEFAFVD